METVARKHPGLLSDIHRTPFRSMVLVRISRKWNVLRSDNEHIGIEMILIDEKKNQIQGTVTKRLLHVFEHVLKEGDLYVLEDFVVSRAMTQHRPIPNDCRILFTFDTIVTPVLFASYFPRYRFYFTDYADITQRLNDNTDLTDVYGWLQHFSPVKRSPKRGNNESVFRELALINERSEILRISLWGDALKQFQQVTPAPLFGSMFIVTSTCVKGFQDVNFLSSTSATKIYVNLYDAHDTHVITRLGKFSHEVTLSASTREISHVEYNTSNGTHKGNLTEDHFQSDQKAINDFISSRWVSQELVICQGKMVPQMSRAEQNQHALSFFDA